MNKILFIDNNRILSDKLSPYLLPEGAVIERSESADDYMSRIIDGSYKPCHNKKQLQISLDMLSDNPCRNVKLQPIKKEEREIYTLEEAQLFLDRLTQKALLIYQCYFILMIYSGFRRGEMCGLTWNNIDFENHIITINKARL